jgi:hypothetical protein
VNIVKGILEKFFGLVLLVGILFGLLVVVSVPIESYWKADAESWPSRRAVVTKSYASHRSGIMQPGRRTTYWKAEICGRYKDNGEEFCASRVRYGHWRFGEAFALESVARYPVGREIDVYYSRNNPKETVLEAHSSWNETFVILGIGVGFLLLPVFLWVFRKKIDPDRYGRT